MIANVPSTTFKLVANALLFQGAWWSAVLLQNDASLLLIGFSVALFFSNTDRIHVATDVCIVFPIMLVVEQALIANGLFEYTHGQLPIFIVLLWLGLVMTSRQSLNFIWRYSFPLQLLILWISSVLSYVAASKFGALSIHVSLFQFAVWFGAPWALCFILSERISNWFNKKYQQLAR
ncbi:hypothetical protein PALB_17650 [Pseudoalteromonas luteoviolacea B = ATCC 29581]|nr:hypothetical protein PALB_17650 [Pseudoalteromonas luteoviolacea B = ATCC 29581]